MKKIIIFIFLIAGIITAQKADRQDYRNWSSSGAGVTTYAGDITFTGSLTGDSAYYASARIGSMPQFNRVFADGYDNLSAAIDSVGATETNLFISGSETISSNDTIPSTMIMEFGRGGSVTLTDTLVVLGWVDAGYTQIFTLSGSGYVDMSNAKNGFVLPEWWGAEAYDLTSDFNGINGAIQSGHKFISFSNGTYYLDSTLTLTGNLTLDGVFNSTKLLMELQTFVGVGDGGTGYTSRQAFTIDGVDSIYISDIVIDGQKGSITDAGSGVDDQYCNPLISINNVEFITFKNVTLQNRTSMNTTTNHNLRHIIDGDSSKHILFDNFKLLNNHNEGIRFDHSQDIVINNMYSENLYIGSTVNGFKMDGLWLTNSRFFEHDTSNRDTWKSSVINANGKRIRILNNVFVGSRGIDVGNEIDDSLYNADDVLVQGNYVKAIDYGLRCAMNNYDIGEYSNNIRIDNNIFDVYRESGSPSDGINLYGGHNIQVTNNYIGSEDYGIRLYSFIDSTWDSQFNNNVIMLDDTVSAYDYGIFVRQPKLRNVEFNGNSIYNFFESGILFNTDADSTDTYYENISVSDNYFKSSDSADAAQNRPVEFGFINADINAYVKGLTMEGNESHSHGSPFYLTSADAGHTYENVTISGWKAFPIDTGSANGFRVYRVDGLTMVNNYFENQDETNYSRIYYCDDVHYVNNRHNDPDSSTNSAYFVRFVSNTGLGTITNNKGDIGFSQDLFGFTTNTWDDYLIHFNYPENYSGLTDNSSFSLTTSTVFYVPVNLPVYDTVYAGQSIPVVFLPSYANQQIKVRQSIAIVGGTTSDSVYYTLKRDTSTLLDSTGCSTTKVTNTLNSTANPYDPISLEINRVVGDPDWFTLTVILGLTKLN